MGPGRQCALGDGERPLHTSTYVVRRRQLETLISLGMYCVPHSYGSVARFVKDRGVHGSYRQPSFLVSILQRLLTLPCYRGYL